MLPRAYVPVRLLLAAARLPASGRCRDPAAGLTKSILLEVCDAARPHVGPIPGSTTGPKSGLDGPDPTPSAWLPHSSMRLGHEKPRFRLRPHMNRCQVLIERLHVCAPNATLRKAAVAVSYLTAPITQLCPRIAFAPCCPTGYFNTASNIQDCCCCTSVALEADGLREAVLLERGDGAVAGRVGDEAVLFAATGDLEGAKGLIENGVSVNSADYNDRSALHLAAERGHIELVEYLISEGADVQCRDHDGETPLSLAAKRKHINVQIALRKLGASPSDLRNRHGLNKASRAMHASFAVMEAFPQPIALAMLEGRTIQAISKDSVSLFFSDIVGFTKMSSTMSAAKVTDLLNKLFRKFDRLAHTHGVQKIDTIGDAYIAATNFTEDQPDDHAARLARFAVDAMQAAHETLIDEADAALGCLQMRVGMHCGSVSGSVIGSQNLKYTLLGDAVNTASRMESSGLPGRIQCSESTAALLAVQAGGLVLTRREGGADVKGKGHMHTFWVSASRRHSLRRSGSCPDLAVVAAAAAKPHPAQTEPPSPTRKALRGPAAPAGPCDAIPAAEAAGGACGWCASGI